MENQSHLFDCETKWDRRRWRGEQKGGRRIPQLCRTSGLVSPPHSPASLRLRSWQMSRRFRTLVSRNLLFSYFILWPLLVPLGPHPSPLQPLQPPQPLTEPEAAGPSQRIHPPPQTKYPLDLWDWFPVPRPGPGSGCDYCLSHIFSPRTRFHPEPPAQVHIVGGGFINSAPLASCFLGRIGLTRALKRTHRVQIQYNPRPAMIMFWFSKFLFVFYVCD